MVSPQPAGASTTVVVTKHHEVDVLLVVRVHRLEPPGLGGSNRLFKLSRAMWFSRLRPAGIRGCRPTLFDGVG